MVKVSSAYSWNVYASEYLGMSVPVHDADQLVEGTALKPVLLEPPGCRVLGAQSRRTSVRLKAGGPDSVVLAKYWPTRPPPPQPPPAFNTVRSSRTSTRGTARRRTACRRSRRASDVPPMARTFLMEPGSLDRARMLTEYFDKKESPGGPW